MNRSTAGALALALVGILAVALVAATVPSTVTPDRPNGGAGGGTGGTAGEGAGQGGGATLPGWLLALVDGLLAALRPVAALLLVVLLLYGLLYSRELISGASSRLPALALALVLLLLLAALLSLFAASFPHLSDVFGRPNVPTSGGGGNPVTVSPSTVLVALVVVVGVATLAWVALRRSSTPGAEPEPSSAEEAAVGRAAGRAVDELSGSDPDVENAVYRAWREMTDSLRVENGAARTPGEFAQAAVDAGFDPDDVRELTRLFEDVRYGNTAATPALEERAVEVFRRIEADAEADR